LKLRTHGKVLALSTKFFC